MRHWPLLLVFSLGVPALAAPTSIRLLAPRGYLPGGFVPVRAELRHADGSLAREVWDAEVTLSSSPAGAVSPTSIRLWNGVGSALVSVSGGQNITLTAQYADLAVAHALESRSAEPVVQVSGTLSSAVVEWSGVVRLTDSVIVPTGTTLRILPGTLVLIDGVVTTEGQPGACRTVAETPNQCGRILTVRGTIEALGLEDDPIHLTATDTPLAWGEIFHDDAQPSFYDYTFITRAGNSPRGGHTNTGPAIRLDDSRVSFDGCLIGFTAGKSMQAEGSNLELRDTLLTRSIMGPEIDGTALLFEDSYCLEFYGSDDNDGIYLHSQRDGQRIALTRGIVASGDDDGIDTLGSDVLIEDCIVRDFANPDEDSKGISVFSGDVTVRRTIVAANKVGLTAKSQNGGSATVHMERCTIADNTEIGLQAQDKFDEPDLRIRLFVSSSIIRSPEAVRTDYPQFPDDIQITYSNLSAPWTGVGNITSNPLFAAARDYRLTPDSPCIDTGDAALPPDPDGSRADMGAIFYTSETPIAPAFVRGRVNDDLSVDISDAVTTLLYLFAGGTITCPDAADANDDGSTSVTDAVFLLEFLFRGGQALPGPSGACGMDPTEDLLACALPAC